MACPSIPDSTPTAVPRPGCGRTYAVAALLAVTLTAAHLALVLSFAGMPTWGDAYRGLHRWDSGWYEGIAKSGYNCPPTVTPENHGNCAFLPAFPLLARQIHLITGIPWPYPVQVAGQVASVVFWFYLLLLLTDLGLPPPWIGLTVVLLFAHPAAFFLVLGYTESLFMAGALGYLYWARRSSRFAFAMACLHGMVMCSTRIVGVTVALYPVVHAWAVDGQLWAQLVRLRPGRSLVRCGAMAACAGLGLLLFFAYCWWRFGVWNLYFKVEAVGWGVVPDYLAFFHRRTLLIGPRLSLVDLYLDPDNLSRQCVPLTILLFAGLACVEYRWARRGDRSWRERLGFYIAAALMFYLNVAGRSSLLQAGMIRYAHTTEALLLLAAVPLLWRTGWLERVPPWRRVGVYVFIVLISLWGQIAYIYRFVNRGEWVA